MKKFAFGINDDRSWKRPDVVLSSKDSEHVTVQVKRLKLLERFLHFFFGEDLFLTITWQGAHQVAEQNTWTSLPDLEVRTGK